MLPVRGMIAVAQSVYTDPTHMKDEPPPRSWMIVGSAVEMVA
jgi:hypothetical protein